MCLFDAASPTTTRQHTTLAIKRRDTFRTTASAHPTHNQIQPPPNPTPQVSRAEILLGGLAAGAAALTGGLALPSLASAEEAATAAPADLGPAPTNFALSKEYYKDAAQMLQHMKCVVSAFCLLGWLGGGGGGGRLVGPLD